MDYMKSINKKITLIIMLVSLLIALAGCTPAQPDQTEEPFAPTEENTTKDPLIITDMAGRTVEIPDNIEKVSTLCGCAHRFLVYLDAADMISGVRESEKRVPLRSPWNMAIKDQIFDIPVISGEDAETIIAVKPDIMIATQTADGFDFFEHELLAEKVGIPLVILRPYVSFSAHQENVFETIRILGQILDREQRAAELTSAIKLIIEDLDQRTRDLTDDQKPTVYVGGKAWAGSHGIISTSSMYTAFDFINANNVAAEVGEENAFIDKEALLLWDPEFIFLESTGLEQAMEDLRAPEFANLKAVKNGNIYRIHPKIWTNTNYETVLVNAYYIGSIIYPEQFNDLDFVTKANEVYTTFLGTSVLKDMIEVHGPYEKLEL
jgi:iron complex transport system substrate-binding protein